MDKLQRTTDSEIIKHHASTSIVSDDNHRTRRDRVVYTFRASVNVPIDGAGIPPNLLFVRLCAMRVGGTAGGSAGGRAKEEVDAEATDGAIDATEGATDSGEDGIGETLAAGVGVGTREVAAEAMPLSGDRSTSSSGKGTCSAMKVSLPTEDIPFASQSRSSSSRGFVNSHSSS